MPYWGKHWELTSLKNPFRFNSSVAAIDGTGFESRHVSRYFLGRRCGLKNGGFYEEKFKDYPKLNLVADCASHLILAAFPCRGPGGDFKLLKPTLERMPAGVSLNRLLGDMGYDAEHNHKYLREELNAKSIIEPRLNGRNNIPKNGRYRRLMAKIFGEKRPKAFGQRWQVETSISMVKRRLGAALSARSNFTQAQELLLKVIVLNIAIIANV